MRKILLIAIALLSQLPKFVSGDDALWHAGASSTVITPDESMWMAGYAGRKGPSEGKLTDLYAKVLSLKDNSGKRVVFVTCDLISIPKPLREQVAKAAQEKYKLDPAGLLLNCSHTHCGPVVRDNVEMSVMYPLDSTQASRVEKYFVVLRDKIVDAIGQAISRMEPSKLAYGYARCGFAMNRRLPTATDFKNSPYPEGVIDHQVPVLRIDSKDGKLLSVVFGYACHNTSTGLMQFNADYAGYAQAEIEQMHPGTVALFMMGCGGDQNPYPRGKIEHAQKHGTALAMAVEAALLPEPKPIRGPLRYAYEEIDLPFAPVTKDEVTKWKTSKDVYDQRRADYLLKEIETHGQVRTSYPYPIQSIRLGDDLTLITLGGEVVVDYALRLKRESKGTVWVAGYSNDVMAYIPSERVLREGGYEGGGAMRFSNLPNSWRPGVEDRIIHAIEKQLASISQ